MAEEPLGDVEHLVELLDRLALVVGLEDRGRVGVDLALDLGLFIDLRFGWFGLRRLHLGLRPCRDRRTDGLDDLRGCRLAVLRFDPLPILWTV